MKTEDLKSKIIKDMLNDVYGYHIQSASTLSCRVQSGNVNHYFTIKNGDNFNYFKDYVLSLIGREFNSRTMTNISIGKGLQLGDIEYDKIKLSVEEYESKCSKPYTTIVTICSIYGGRL